MKLTEFNLNTISIAKKALKENFNMPFNMDTLTPSATNAMLKKVRGLISETRESSQFYESQNSPAYMKLVMMQQALTKRVSEYAARPANRIVVENEEVEKSQVVLAAQDMVDSVQKMLEQVSDMLVKELPALTDSVQSEIGVDESTQYSSQVAEALTTLTAALTQSKATLQGALGVVTGQGGAPEAFGDEDMGAEEDMGADDLGSEEDMGLEDDMEDLGDEDFPAEEEPELAPTPSVGRVKR